MRYALLICNDENAALSPEEGAAQFAAYNVFTEKMNARGVLKDRGVRLQPATSATTVQVRDGALVVADGPFAETKEQIGGLFIIECKDLDEAIEIAAEIPGASNGTIEVRPVWDM